MILYKFYKKKKKDKRTRFKWYNATSFCLTFEIMKLFNSVIYLINCPHVSSVDVCQI